LNTDGEKAVDALQLLGLEDRDPLPTVETIEDIERSHNSDSWQFGTQVSVTEFFVFIVVISFFSFFNLLGGLLTGYIAYLIATKWGSYDLKNNFNQ